MGNTWQVKNGFSSTIVISILLLGLLTGTLERLFRTSQLQHALPIPSVSQNQKRHFDLQVTLLHDYIAQHGTPTCFILGSSMAQRGLQPAILESHLTTIQAPLKCFNFALVGASIESSLYTAQWLLDQYRPSLLIVGIAARDMPPPIIKSIVTDNAWLRQQHGQFTWEGWLLTHWWSYRYYNIAGLLDEKNRHLVDWQSWQADGTSIAHTVKLDLYQSLLEPYPASHYEITPVNRTALETFLQVNQNNSAAIVFIEMPVHPLYVQNFPQGAADQAFFIETVGTLTHEYGRPFWQTTALQMIPTEGWEDDTHVRFSGMLVLSDWVGYQLAAWQANSSPQNYLDQPPQPTYQPDLQTIALQHGISLAHIPLSLDPWEGQSIFSPSSLFEQRSWMQVNLAAYLQETVLSPAEYFSGQQLLTVLDHLTLKSEYPVATQALLEAWSEDKSADWLAQAGIEWLLVDQYWLGWLSDEELALLENPQAYQKVATWQHPGLNMALILSLYRVMP